MPESADSPNPTAATEPSGAAAAANGRHLIMLSGISGGGKTTAMKAFEDIGFEAVDNPPFSLLVPLLRAPPADRVVVGVDARTIGLDVDELLKHWRSPETAAGWRRTIVFLDCDEETALRRFKETRRRHPLAAGGSPREGLAIEEQLLAPLRAQADHMLDTSIMSPRELKRWVTGSFAAEGPVGMAVQIESFSYRRGVPREADLVFDVRFLANPHYDERLRPMSGLDPEVGAYIEADPGAAQLLNSLEGLLSFLLPRYEQEGKSYLTIAIGCTGGRHRSVFIAEKLAAMLFGQGWPVTTTHRDKDRERHVQANR